MITSSELGFRIQDSGFRRKATSGWRDIRLSPSISFGLTLLWAQIGPPLIVHRNSEKSQTVCLNPESRLLTPVLLTTSEPTA
jgi:hypothetical protein